jgi:hypothetical protein
MWERPSLSTIPAKSAGMAQTAMAQVAAFGARQSKMLHLSTGSAGIFLRSGCFQYA